MLSARSTLGTDCATSNLPLCVTPEADRRDWAWQRAAALFFEGIGLLPCELPSMLLSPVALVALARQPSICDESAGFSGLHLCGSFSLALPAYLKQLWLPCGFWRFTKIVWLCLHATRPLQLDPLSAYSPRTSSSTYTSPTVIALRKKSPSSSRHVYFGACKTVPGMSLRNCRSSSV